VVVSLGIRPSVRFGQILKSSDEIRSGNGVLAFGTKEFRNFVLLHLEVEVRGPVASTWCGGNISLGRGVAGAVVVSIEIDVVITDVVIVVVVFWGQVDIVTSSSSHFESFKFSYLNSCGFSDPCCGVCDPMGVIIYVVVLGAVLESAY
jgi:hypothetical protein